MYEKGVLRARGYFLDFIPIYHSKRFKNKAVILGG